MVLGPAPTALAHTAIFPVDVTLEAQPTVVSSGDTVVFKGEASSPRRACEQGATVKLIRVGVGVIATTTTKGDGRFRFPEPVLETGRFRVRYTGEVLNGEHPHLHVCSADRSNGVRVRVV